MYLLIITIYSKLTVGNCYKLNNFEVVKIEGKMIGLC